MTEEIERDDTVFTYTPPASEDDAVDHSLLPDIPRSTANDDDDDEAPGVFSRMWNGVSNGFWKAYYTADWLGEKLAWFFGITQSRYYDEALMADRIFREIEQEREYFNSLEMNQQEEEAEREVENPEQAAEPVQVATVEVVEVEEDDSEFVSVDLLEAGDERAKTEVPTFSAIDNLLPRDDLPDFSMLPPGMSVVDFIYAQGIEPTKDGVQEEETRGQDPPVRVSVV